MEKDGVFYNEVMGNEEKTNSSFSKRDNNIYKPRIVIIGVGGGGCNTISTIAKIGGIDGVQLVAINTDAQHLKHKVPDNVKKILIGERLTRGLGAGGDPEVGMRAAEASKKEISGILEGADLVFLCSGMGGGTGTGAAPIVAQVAKEKGAIVISIVTTPFKFEGGRAEIADEGIEKLRKHSNTVIIIDNNRLIELYPNLDMAKAFKAADLIVATSVKGLIDTMNKVSLINIDYADIRAVMRNGDFSLIAVGEATGPDRVKKVIENTLNNALLDVDYSNAKGAIIHITGGPELTMKESYDIYEGIRSKLNEDVIIKPGARVDSRMEGKIRVIAIITGVSSPLPNSKLRNGEKIEEDDLDFFPITPL